ncbi:hypothetical protein AB0K16_29225 [Nonomuraea jabiensis]|uniref:hypothetical protein n=1 Tax=Nonomuraea jabiensis TaxID=882448 RepID=UPI00343C7DE6
MISKIEAGSRRLDALELARVVRVLDMPIGHFLNAPPAVTLHRTPLAEDTATNAAQARAAELINPSEEKRLRAYPPT